jgi:hypothetical protein
MKAFGYFLTTVLGISCTWFGIWLRLKAHDLAWALEWGYSGSQNEARGKTKPEESVIQEDGTSMTVITGIVPDQAALFGMPCRVRDPGLVLISVE